MPAPEIAIARIIAQRRDELGLTQEELASRSLIKVSRIGRLERGKANLHYPEVDRLAHSLNWTRADFDRAFNHALDAPDAPGEPFDLLAESMPNEIRDTDSPIYDLTKVEPGSTFGIQYGRRLFLLKLKSIVRLQEG